LFKQLTGTFITHIPYRGSGPAVQDLAGQVDIFITTPAGVSQIQGGRLKGVGVTSKKRLSSLPEVPTTTEAGLSGFELTLVCAVRPRRHPARRGRRRTARSTASWPAATPARRPRNPAPMSSR
jgi:tripartite-type tricarboxylate transporter receptor subunit TctC